MKKILSLLLAFIVCLGAFVSCGNEEHSSQSEKDHKDSFQSEESSVSTEEISSESTKESEVVESSKKDDETANNTPNESSQESDSQSEESGLVVESQYTYYEELLDLSDYGLAHFVPGTPHPDEYWQYLMFTTYEEMEQKLASYQKEYLDEAIFDEHVVIWALHFSDSSMDFEYIGWRNLIVDGTTLVVECDRIPSESIIGEYYFHYYYAIPRSEFGNISPESITRIKVNINTISKD